MILGERAGLAALAIAAVAGWLAFPVQPTYDSLFSLVWGREILHGDVPSFAAAHAPTQHPLWVAVSTVLAALGGAGPRAMTAIGASSFVALLAGTYVLGRTVFGPLAGALAAALLLTRLDFGFYAAFAFVDVPFVALVVWAAALEAQRPRREGRVWILLVLAGLLRPEGWLYAAVYGLWLAWRSPRTQWSRLAVLVATAPVIWALTDLVVTGNPVFSLAYTTGEAAELGRQRGPLEVPGAFLSTLSELLKPPLVAAGVVGVAVAVRELPLVRMRVPLALLAIGATTFTMVLLAGVSGQVPRYQAITAIAVLLFAGNLVARLAHLPAERRERVAWGAALVLLAVGAAYSATRLHPTHVASELRFREHVEDDLVAVLGTRAVQRGRACGPLRLPTHKLVPHARWALHAPPDAVLEPAAEKRDGRGVALLALGTRLLGNAAYGPFTEQSRTPALVSQVPPPGYIRAERSQYFAVYVRC